MGSNDSAAAQAAAAATPKKGMRGLWIFLAVAAAAWFASPFALRWLIPTLDSRGVFGDSFGALNALFSGLAFAGVVYAILQQNESRDQQAEALRLQARALDQQAESLQQQATVVQQQAAALQIQQQELRLQLDEMKETRAEMQRQTDAAKAQRRALLLSAAIAATNAQIHLMRPVVDRSEESPRKAEVHRMFAERLELLRDLLFEVTGELGMKFADVEPSASDSASERGPQSG